MSDISTITQHQVMSVVSPPTIRRVSGELGAAIACLERGLPPGKVQVDEDGTARLLGISSAQADAAEQHLAVLQPLLEPGDAALMLAWLCHLRHSVRGAPEAWRAILAKAGAIWEECQDLPRGVWCEETRRLWRRQPARGDFCPGEFWPLPGPLRAILADYAGQLRSEALGCARLIERRAAAPEPAWVPPTEEEKAQVRAMLAARRAELDGAMDGEKNLAPAPGERQATLVPAEDPGSTNWSRVVGRVVAAAVADRQEIAA